MSKNLEYALCLQEESELDYQLVLHLDVFGTGIFYGEPLSTLISEGEEEMARLEEV